MWRFFFLGVLGIIIGTRARSERGVVLMSLIFGLVYGTIEVVSLATVLGSPSPSRTLFTLGLGLVMATPVYAVGEIWRRTRVRAWGWLKRRLR